MQWPCWRARFLSTLPARGATQAQRQTRLYNAISIHAPREGSDLRRPCNGRAGVLDFYPRSPRGERQQAIAASGHASFQFLSTLPARGATIVPLGCAWSGIKISIHAPREGSDFAALPGGVLSKGISIHAPREGSDPLSASALLSRGINFYPRSPRGERQNAE